MKINFAKILLLLFPELARSEVVKIGLLETKKVTTTPTEVNDLCEDSPLFVLTSRGDISCALLEERPDFCDFETAQRHCPFSCGSCMEYGCEDSIVPWSFNDGGNNGVYKCSKLATFNEDFIAFYCNLYNDIKLTCRSTCGYCASTSPTLSPSLVVTTTPTESNSGTPSKLPSFTPTLSPSRVLSLRPSTLPSSTPSLPPTLSPTRVLSLRPSVAPTELGLVKIVPPDGSYGDDFGASVAISEEVVIVGSRKESVYVYTRDGLFNQTLTPPDATSELGTRKLVAASESLVVFSDSGKNNNMGAAYFFAINGTFIKNVTAPDGASGDSFGKSIAASNDIVVVGAIGPNDDESKKGAAYVYSIEGDFLIKIIAPDGAIYDAFGRAVAISGSLVVVGAHQDDDAGESSGSVYFFESSGTFISKVVAPDGAANDNFGFSVSATSDFVFVGSVLGNNFKGAVYIYSVEGDFVDKITAPDGAAGDRFGFSVSASSDIVVVGAYYDENNTGSVYFFDIDGTFIEKVTADDGAADDFFGFSVSISNDIAVIGEYGDDDDGSAYIFAL